ncbi:hypothetical protein VT03_19255 [Planctomyces sp. SH-PL14]|nr:hypothetical protein VT03_19255 [Planctomyces sp. SH-PL14]
MQGGVWRRRKGFRLKAEGRAAQRKIIWPSSGPGAPWSGDARGTCVVFWPLARRRPDRRVMSEGGCVQARTPCRMPPHQPAGIPPRAVSSQRRSHKAIVRHLPRFLVESPPAARWPVLFFGPLTPAAVARWVRTNRVHPARAAFCHPARSTHFESASSSRAAAARIVWARRSSESFSSSPSPSDEGGSRRSKFNVVSCPSATSTSADRPDPFMK